MNWERKHVGLFTQERQIYIQIPFLIWLKLLQTIIEPILLYASEVWGPQTNQLFDHWEKHPIEIANTEFCKSILQVHRTTTNNACRAELGQYPLLLKIQKRSIKCWPTLLPAQSPAKPRGEQESPHSAGPETLSTDRFPLCSASGPGGEHIN